MHYDELLLPKQIINDWCKKLCGNKRVSEISYSSLYRMAIYKEKNLPILQSRVDIVLATVIGVLIGYIVANRGLWGSNSNTSFLKFVDMIANLKKQVKEINGKLKLAEEAKFLAENQVMMLCKQHKAGPFGTVKASGINPTVIPDKSVNPTLANMLERLAINKDIIVALANSNVKEMLEIWYTSIKKVGIANYLVIALDDHILNFCKSNGIHVYKRDSKDKIDKIARKGDKFIVSGFKFQVLREFLQLGYSVLLSDVDIVFLQNPFKFLYRDSDIECTTDGHDNQTAYGFNEFFEDPTMGQSTRFVYTSKIWTYNSGFFYIRPTAPSIELLDRVTSRLSQDSNLWDQAVFHEELFTTSHPGYNGLHASKRFMDFYLFMNSKVLFRFVRKDTNLRKLKPVIVHVNYHSDKLERMRAIMEYYVEGNQDSLDPFPDGSKE